MSSPSAPAQRRVCVVLPTYNNRATVGGVVREVLAAVPAGVGVLVVDDGSTDGAEEVLGQFPEIQVVIHEQNQGKGAALATGLGRAAELGFSHAITMDADGQHSASDLAKFLAAVEERPDALVVGVRDLVGAGARRRSRLLRAHSNFWVWFHTGQWVHDTQSGFRAYPLAPILALRLKTRRYDFEVEAVVKALWSGVPLVEVPVEVRYGTGSPSHFRPVRDFALVCHLNGFLFWQRVLLPASVRRVYHLKSFHEGPWLRRGLEVARGAVFQETVTAAGFALCMGTGVFFGILPIWGFQMAAAVVVAHRLRLSKPLVLAASNVSFPVLIPLILWLSLLVGHFVFTGSLALNLSFHGLTRARAWSYAGQYLVGAVILAAAAGLAATAVSYLLARVVLLVRGRRRA